MNKLFIITVTALLLTACNKPNTTTPGQEYVAGKALAMTKGLEDCKLYKFQADTMDHELNIIRCPNSTVSTNQSVTEGKTTRLQTVVTIDGVDYIATKRQ
ncbi:hypothetical protein FDH01_gp298 [Acinetobacter phage vB_AbaM_ME3]|uniref:Lipoprotein n=1 Tax=Acinetobacter phage vB_AbaM_ME3 TaxID=1837876 RepID=A0A172Q0F2_9CAUD|nr:hypothetical protein FDH01_gp298 [Acinetobacter phage vB_AbaM_ME3]AND75324.1 hypothetical protein ME3_163 [Acinetobacter phage vB_AbaM_ME3]